MQFVAFAVIAFSIYIAVLHQVSRIVSSNGKLAQRSAALKYACAQIIQAGGQGNAVQRGAVQKYRVAESKIGAAVRESDGRKIFAALKGIVVDFRYRARNGNRLQTIAIFKCIAIKSRIAVRNRNVTGRCAAGLGRAGPGGGERGQQFPLPAGQQPAGHGLCAGRTSPHRH